MKTQSTEALATVTLRGGTTFEIWEDPAGFALWDKSNAQSESNPDGEDTLISVYENSVQAMGALRQQIR